MNIYITSVLLCNNANLWEGLNKNKNPISKNCKSINVGAEMVSNNLN